VSGAIGYLLVRSARNRTRRIASEFKKPGPRIAAVAAIGYFVFLAWLSPKGGGGTHDTQIAAVVGALVAIRLTIKGASALASMASHEARYRMQSGQLPGRR